MSTSGELLLVEDDPDISEIISVVLEGANFAVRTARNLSEAKANIATNAAKLDALIVDKNLPDGSGLQLLSFAKEKECLAQVVLITGYASVESAVQALRLGAYDYLEKPFRSLDDVVATVQRACEKSRLTRERDDALRRAILAERRATLVQVAAGLAHEVKNPLQGVQFALANLREIIEGAPFTPPQRKDADEQVGLIAAESERLRMLVEGVMDLARPAPRPHQPIAIDRLLASVLVLHTTRAEKLGVRLQLSCPKNLNFLADEGDLSRALDNLVRNALEASPVGSTVRVNARKKGSIIEMEVVDEGPGFSEEARAHAFEPFFTTKARGFGLGLCTVAAAADRAGGVVELLSNEPHGAKVVLQLPARTAHGGREASGE